MKSFLKVGTLPSIEPNEATEKPKAPLSHTIDTGSGNERRAREHKTCPIKGAEYYKG